MNKTTILYLSIGAIALFILGLILVGVGAGNNSAGLALVGLILYSLAGLLTFLSWLFGIIRTIRGQAWGWFVVILLFSPIATLIYGLMGPAVHTPRAASQQ